MKRFTSLILLLILSLNVACEKSDLKENFQCEASAPGNTKNYKDILKHFEIGIPKDWKTILYYDEYVSNIYSADTSKSLTQTYIVDITWHQGELLFDKAFEANVKSTLDSSQMHLTKKEFIKFKKYPAYYFYSQGKYMEYDYHLLEVYVKTKPDEFYSFLSKVYGKENVKERVCESIALFEDISIK
jgi:hypothetical protein